MKQLPLVFTFKQIVLGDGFVAGVSMRGRALLEDGGEETWITGVAPAGLAGGGIDRASAFADFRKGWAEILFDIASDSTSFSDFKDRCSDFLATARESITQEWLAALEEVRRTQYEDHALARTEGADEQPVCFDVVELSPREFGPQYNEVESGLQAAA